MGSLGVGKCIFLTFIWRALTHFLPPAPAPVSQDKGKVKDEEKGQSPQSTGKGGGRNSRCPLVVAEMANLRSPAFATRLPAPGWTISGVCQCAAPPRHTALAGFPWSEGQSLFFARPPSLSQGPEGAPRIQETRQWWCAVHTIPQSLADLSPGGGADWFLARIRVPQGSGVGNKLRNPPGRQTIVRSCHSILVAICEQVSYEIL